MAGVNMAKRIILLFIDSFMSDVFEQASKKGLVPTLDFLRSHGAYWPDCVTIFPTMSASVDGSLLTGTYPDVHKLPGILWYNRNENRVVNYGNGPGGVLKIGLTQCAFDIAYSMNHIDFNREVKTIYEELEEQGIPTGSINCMIHRGTQKYDFVLPGLLKLLFMKLKVPAIHGPKVFSMGKFARTPLVEGVKWKWNQSIFKRYGYNDSFAMDLLKKLVEENSLPQFTIVYMPDTDYSYHRHPEQGPEILGKADRQLARLFQSFGGAEKALESCTFIVLGDHGQSKNGFDAGATVDLEPIFQGMKLGKLKKVNPDVDDLIICNNERMCYLYPLKSGVLEEVVKRLAEDPRIDLIAWKEEQGVRIQSGEKSLFFAPGEGVVDPYGRSWRIKGEEVLGMAINEGTISFGDYPDLFSRLYGGLYAHEGQVITVTTYPGYDFYTKWDPVHRGGASHGSLHRSDSLVPLIITGETKDALQCPRIVDLKPYIIQKLKNG